MGYCVIYNHQLIRKPSELYRIDNIQQIIIFYEIYFTGYESRFYYPAYYIAKQFSGITQIQKRQIL